MDDIRFSIENVIKMSSWFDFGRFFMMKWRENIEAVWLRIGTHSPIHPGVPVLTASDFFFDICIIFGQRSRIDLDQQQFLEHLKVELGIASCSIPFKCPRICYWRWINERFCISELHPLFDVMLFLLCSFEFRLPFFSPFSKPSSWVSCFFFANKRKVIKNFELEDSSVESSILVSWWLYPNSQF